MTDQIHIFDNFLTQEEIQRCVDATKRPAWSMSQISHSSPDSTPFWMMALTDDPFFNSHLKSKIETTTNRKFAVQRIYANGQTFGQDGTYHRDSALDNSYTFCLYINGENNIYGNDDIGGEFIFKIPENFNNPLSRIMIPTYYNRGIFFPATYLHKGMAFNRYFKGLRISITWKLLASQIDI